MSYKIHEQNFRGAMVIIFIFGEFLSFAFRVCWLCVMCKCYLMSRRRRIPQIVVDASTYSFQAFAVCYSPAMGPIPFTLASESFPLSHREAVSLAKA